MQTDDAFQITQDFLDRQGEVTLAGDIDATLEYCDLPCTLESMDTLTVVTDWDQMRAICVRFVEELRARRVSHTIRECREAVRKDDTTIWAAYETRHVSDGKFLNEDPYSAFLILKKRGGQWKISTMQFAVDRDSAVNASLTDWAAAISKAVW